MTDGVIIASIISGGGVLVAAIVKFVPSRNGSLIADFKEALREEVGKPLAGLTLIESKADGKHDRIIEDTGKIHTNVGQVKEYMGQMSKDVGFLARDQNTLFNKYDELNSKTIRIETDK
jgi:hypothetical protein